MHGLSGGERRERFEEAEWAVRKFLARGGSALFHDGARIHTRALNAALASDRDAFLCDGRMTCCELSIPLVWKPRHGELVVGERRTFSNGAAPLRGVVTGILVAPTGAVSVIVRDEPGDLHAVYFREPLQAELFVNT